MNVLLINLTRFGDLLQSQALLSDMSRQGHVIGLVCLENFSGVAELLNHVHYLAPLPGGSLLKAVSPYEEGQPSSFWMEGLARLYQWRRQVIREFAYDAVCNVTPTLSARLLSRFLAPEGAKIFGLGIDDEGFGTASNAWAAFLQGASAVRGVSPFNVVDLFRRAGRIPEDKIS